MASKAVKKTAREISDQVAKDALCSGGKSGPMPTHPAMEATEENPEASATDASEDDDSWDENRQGN